MKHLMMKSQNLMISNIEDNFRRLIIPILFNVFFSSIGFNLFFGLCAMLNQSCVRWVKWKRRSTDLYIYTLKKMRCKLLKWTWMTQSYSPLELGPVKPIKNIFEKSCNLPTILCGTVNTIDESNCLFVFYILVLFW